jgi:hypothetical protein
MLLSVSKLQLCVKLALADYFRGEKSLNYISVQNNNKLGLGLLSSETAAKGTNLGRSAGKEGPVELEKRIT